MPEQDVLATDRDIEFKAKVLVETGRRSPHVFARNGRTFGPLVSFQSQPLVRDLMKLGIFSMNLQTMAELEATAPGAAKFGKVPAALLAMGFHYAIDVAPGDVDPENGIRTVLVDDLERHVDRIETAFGQIDIDPQLVERVSIVARELTLMPDGPANGGRAGGYAG